MRTLFKNNYAWLIGFVCIILALALFLNYGFNLNWRADKSWVEAIVLYYIVIFIVAFVGLIRGIKEIKIKVNVLGLFGIILCLLAIFLSIVIGYWMVIAISVSST